MSRKKPDPELIDQDNPEWREEDFRRARPASEVLPALMGKAVAAEMLKARGRPKAVSVKAHLNLRLDVDVLEAFKKGGPGWQTRMNDALRQWLEEHRHAV